jgi:mono/diheme cytochrome c family protein
MRSTPLGLAMSAAILALATSAWADAALQERGHRLAEAKCARCHAIGAAGASPVVPAPPFRLLPRRYPVESLAEALAEGIVVGHPMMPEFKFDPPEIDALLAYIESLAPARKH